MSIVDSDEIDLLMEVARASIIWRKARSAAIEQVTGETFDALANAETMLCMAADAYRVKHPELE